MISQEIIEMGGKKYKRTYSSENYYIKKIGTNEIYADAVDLLGTNYNYEETEQKIENEREE